MSIADGLFHGVQLLRQIQAGTGGFQHFNDRCQVSVSTLQSSGDLGEFVHEHILSL
jgi:hypothetical protein